MQNQKKYKWSDQARLYGKLSMEFTGQSYFKGEIREKQQTTHLIGLARP